MRVYFSKQLWDVQEPFVRSSVHFATPLPLHKSVSKLFRIRARAAFALLLSAEKPFFVFSSRRGSGSHRALAIDDPKRAFSPIVRPM
jgi:hypothetical protein